MEETAPTGSQKYHSGPLQQEIVVHENYHSSKMAQKPQPKTTPATLLDQERLHGQRAAFITLAANKTESRQGPALVLVTTQRLTPSALPADTDIDGCHRSATDTKDTSSEVADTNRPPAGSNTVYSCPCGSPAPPCYKAPRPPLRATSPTRVTRVILTCPGKTPSTLASVLHIPVLATRPSR